MGANWGLLNGINMGLREGIDAYISERDKKLAREERGEERTYKRGRDAYDDAFRRLEAKKSGYNMDESGSFSETDELLKKKDREEKAAQRNDALYDPNSSASALEREINKGLIGGTKYKGLIRDDMDAATSQRVLKEVNPFLQRESSERNAQAARAATAALRAGTANPNKRAYDQLPKENQLEVEKLAGSSAGKKAIGNALKADLQLLDDPSLNDEQKLVHARSMIKTLNSQQGQDAVGAEEAKRLAALLEFNLVNFQQPGPKGIWPFGAGRAPISDFANQARNTVGSIEKTIDANNKEVDRLYGRGGGMAAAPKGPDPAAVSAYAKRYGLDEAHAEAILQQRMSGGGASGVAGR